MVAMVVDLLAVVAVEQVPQVDVDHLLLLEMAVMVHLHQ